MAKKYKLFQKTQNGKQEIPLTDDLENYDGQLIFIDKTKPNIILSSNKNKIGIGNDTSTTNNRIIFNKLNSDNSWATDTSSTYYDFRGIIQQNGYNLINTNEIVDNVSTDSGDKVLSARQGKVLNDKITTTNTSINQEITDRKNAISQEAKAREEAIDNAISKLVNGSPEALDTLLELSAALGNDPNFATTMVNALAKKVDKETNKALISNYRSSDCDFNDFTGAGFYYLTTGLTNSPDVDISSAKGQYYHLLVVNGGGDTECIQIASHPTDNMIFARKNSYSAGWTSWIRIDGQDKANLTDFNNLKNDYEAFITSLENQEKTKIEYELLYEGYTAEGVSTTVFDGCTDGLYLVRGGDISTTYEEYMPLIIAGGVLRPFGVNIRQKSTYEFNFYLYVEGNKLYLKGHRTNDISVDLIGTKKPIRSIYKLIFKE